MDFQLSQEQRALVDLARAVATDHLAPRAAVLDREMSFPHENVEVLAKTGLLGLGLPVSHGGGGASALELALVLEQLAAACPSTALVLGAQSGFGAKAIALFGSDQMRDDLLPAFASGQHLLSWAMSEPGAGSDIGRMHTNASAVSDGYLLSGEKTWISLATVADYFVVITRFDGEPGLPGLGAVVLPRETPGLEVGAKIETLGIRATGMATVRFDGCFVPAERVLLGPGRFRDLLRIMSGERAAGNPPIALGIGQAALEAARGYLGTREVGGHLLRDFQGLRWQFADLVVRLEAARLLVYRAAANAAAGLASDVEASMAKIAANEAAIAVADTALQIHGAAGYGREFPVERMLRDARGLSIGDGTVEVQRNLIAGDLLGRPAS